MTSNTELDYIQEISNHGYYLGLPVDELMSILGKIRDRYPESTVKKMEYDMARTEVVTGAGLTKQYWTKYYIVFELLQP